MNKIFLQDEYIKILTDIFDRYCPRAEILIYGSRIKNEAHESSDVDLSVKDFNDSHCNIGELKNKIEESNIPLIIDINDFKTLPDYFQNEILKNNIRFYPKN
ncbi:MAG: nucleotidyltransferase domain-containing protein [Candidatus Gastranaerophilales bacterium]|nr:nucleotidyltransferase domain-containing protein [Candidatus Gastranaerophilales bacterium]